jgi:hypothetical protein
MAGLGPATHDLQGLITVKSWVITEPGDDTWTNRSCGGFPVRMKML